MTPSKTKPTADVLISFAPEDTELASTIAEGLAARGIVASSTAERAGATLESIYSELSAAKCVLALCSQSFELNRRCQMEYVGAWLVGTAEGATTNRLIPLGIDSTRHIHPAALRTDAIRVNGKPASTDLDKLAQYTQTRLKGLSPLGRKNALKVPPWHGIQPAGSERFVGRMASFFQIHDILEQAASDDTQPFVHLGGPSGIGKTLLAEEYALRFGSTYPGGIFWLRAYGTGDSYTGLGTDERDAERDRQIREFAAALGVIVSNMSPDEIREAVGQALDRRALKCLWIVDDVPVELSDFNLKKWLGPSGFANTIVTTRREAYQKGAVSVSVDPLTEDEGYKLLCWQRTPVAIVEEKDAARAIVRDLGGHPLAVDLAGEALWEHKEASFIDFRKQLARPNDTMVSYAQELDGVVPKGHETAIAITLLRAIERLEGEGKEFMRLAAVLAAAPISTTLFAAVLQKVSDLKAEDATAAARRGVEDADLRLLTERMLAGSAFRSVHTLLSRTVRHADPQAVRLDTMRAAAVAAMLDKLPKIYDPTAYSEVEYEIAHARQLVRRARTAQETDLLGRVARYDLVRGGYFSGAALYRRQWKANRDIHGEKSVETVAAMANLAGASFVLGDLAGARKLQEDVLRIRREGLGPDHPDTVIAMNNLAATLGIEGEMEQVRRILEEVLDIRYRMFGASHHDTTAAAWSLFVLLNDMEDDVAAQKIYEKHLSWVLDEQASALRPDQRRIQQALAQVAK